MNFTDIFIKRPVLATVVSLLILVLGLRSLFSLPIRQYPETTNATVTVTTAYYGASPDVVAGFITTPLEAAIAQAQGIDYMTSSSVSGVSTITATLRLNYDPNRALTEITSKVSSVRNQLPPEAQQPTLSIAVGETIDSMYLSFSSDDLPANKITDYLIRVVQPKLQALPGVQTAEVLGGRQFALRAWLDPQKLASTGLTAQDVYTALGNNNYISAVGSTKGQMISINLTANTDLHTLDAFRNLVVKQKGDALVRLQDVANVTLGAENYENSVKFNGKQAVFIGIKVAPEANLLDVIKGVREAVPDIQAQMPAGMHASVVYDATTFVNSSIYEVVKTLVEALLIVTVVIFLFLGTVRSVIIPVIAMPLSLVGTFFIMLALGYTVNLLTLLALVLAIGLVVDDAIIVVENIDRHIKQGMAPRAAALLGARELAGPVIAISVVLIAVYVPIGFQGGLTGALFTEFAFTLAGAVAVSAVVALTLSPVMCGRFLTATEGKFAHKIDTTLERVRGAYEALLRRALAGWKVIVVFGFIIMGLIFVLTKLSQSELAPEEDQGFLVQISSGAPTATIQQMGLYSDEVFKIASQLPEYHTLGQLDGIPTLNGGISFFGAKPWDERSRKLNQVQQELQGKYNEIAGARIAVFSLPALPGGGNGLPLQFVINTTDPFSNLVEVSQALMARAQASGKFYFLDSDLKYDKPQTTLHIDRDKAASMGLTMRDVGASLTAMLGGGYVNYFSIEGRSYKVIPQVQQAERLNAAQLQDYHIRAANGTVVPASTLVTLKTETVPQAINHFQQLNSATISGVAGVPMGEALAVLREIAADVLPAGYSIDYAGQSRQSMQESSGFAVTLAFAVLIIFLVLSAQFESFRDPLIVMMSVPMAIFGAMVFIFEGLATLNIYTQVGLITLVGLIAKHGILIVQFANDEQKAGKSKFDAIMSAAGTRLRPILMTTAAMVLGVIPLVLASGAGAVGRNNMGLVIATGISIGTLFTLFVVPAMYLFIAKDRRLAKAETEPAAVGETLH